MFFLIVLSIECLCLAATFGNLVLYPLSCLVCFNPSYSVHYLANWTTIALYILNYNFPDTPIMFAIHIMTIYLKHYLIKGCVGVRKSLSVCDSLR